MQLCRKCHIDMDRCECREETEQEKLNRLIRELERYNKLAEQKRQHIIKQRKKMGQVF